MHTICCICMVNWSFKYCHRNCLVFVGAQDLRMAMRCLEAGKDLTEPQETGRGCREKKRKLSTSESSYEDEKRDLPVNVHCVTNACQIS